MTGSTVNVMGIGTVDLPTKLPPGKPGSALHGILRLEHVLHIPGNFCNVFGSDHDDRYRFEMPSHKSDVMEPVIDRTTGRSVACLKRGSPFVEICLSEPPIGPRVGASPFQRNGHYMLGLDWPTTERTRIMAQLAADGGGGAPARRQGRAGVTNPAATGTRKTALFSPPLTATEKRWLDEEFDGEFTFLRTQGLSIHNEEDRDEGRRIVRSCISAEKTIAKKKKRRARKRRRRAERRQMS
ncbi:hypothetical protein SPI_09301 [Niveomyces insectorum RCEF 264]|uniref:Uncharacterized protein n=1 Tax=Niveomyces insectorum RCEF 264 TaxID=1081102 RepID=A0A167LW77_9HYPO|nr:hypothetical protein SPI_09301 [Niveomyces insectorum RCEF 264]